MPPIQFDAPNQPPSSEGRGEPPAKARRLGQSAFSPYKRGGDMREVGNLSKLTLKLDARKAVNMPALVAFLAGTLTNLDTGTAESDDGGVVAEYPDLAQFKASPSTSRDDVIGAHLDSCESLLRGLLEKDLPEPLKNTVQQALHADAVFIDYSENMGSFYVGSEHAVLSVINTTRAIARELVRSPMEIIAQAFQHFPPAEDELLCFDGTANRLQSSLDRIHSHQIELGRRTAPTLLQTLNPQVSVPFSLINILLEQTAQCNAIQANISEEMEVHMVKGLYYKAGVEEGQVNSSDIFAISSVVDIAGESFLNQLIDFQQQYIKALSTAVKAPQCVESLKEFELQLQSFLEKNTNTDLGLPQHEIFAQQLAALNKSPLGQFLRIQFNGEGLEQHFALWDDSITEIQGWDWGKLQSHLSSLMDQEWHLLDESSSRSKPMQLMQSPVEYSAIQQRVLPDLPDLLWDEGRETDQYHALQCLLSGLTPGASDSQNFYRQERVKLIRALANVAKTKLGTSDVELSHFSSILKQRFQHNSTNAVNNELMRRLDDELSVQIGLAFPFSSCNLGAYDRVVDCCEKGVFQPLSDLTLLFLSGIEPSMVEASVAQSLREQPEQNSRELVDALVNLIWLCDDNHSDESLSFFDTIASQIPALQHQALIEILSRLYDTEDFISDAWFAVNALGERLKGILGCDELHIDREDLTEFFVKEGLSRADFEVVSLVLSSNGAKQNLLAMEDTSVSSVVMLAEQAGLWQQAPHLGKVIDSMPWPIEHYLGPDGSVDGSPFLKILEENRDTRRFDHFLSVLHKHHRLDTKALYQKMITPFFEALTAPDDVVFLSSMCKTMNKYEQGRRDQILPYIGHLFKRALTNDASQVWRVKALIAVVPDRLLHTFGHLLAAHGTLERDELAGSLEARGIVRDTLLRRYPQKTTVRENWGQILWANGIRPPSESHARSVGEGVTRAQLTRESLESAGILSGHLLDIFKSPAFKAMDDSSEAIKDVVIHLLNKLSYQMKEDLIVEIAFMQGNDIRELDKGVFLALQKTFNDWPTGSSRFGKEVLERVVAEIVKGDDPSIA